MTKQDFVNKLSNTINAREDTHGSPQDTFATIAEIWTALLKKKIMRDVTEISGSLNLTSNFVSSEIAAKFKVTPSEVANMMAAMKIARTADNPYHEDNWIDIAGYAACGAVIVDEVKSSVNKDYVDCMMDDEI